MPFHIFTATLVASLLASAAAAATAAESEALVLVRIQAGINRVPDRFETLTARCVDRTKDGELSRALPACRSALWVAKTQYSYATATMRHYAKQGLVGDLALAYSNLAAVSWLENDRVAARAYLAKGRALAPELAAIARNATVIDVPKAALARAAEL